MFGYIEISQVRLGKVGIAKDCQTTVTKDMIGDVS